MRPSYAAAALLSIASLASIAVLSCGTNETTLDPVLPSDVDASADAPSGDDATPDGPGEAAPDSAADAAPDAPAQETGPDAAPDALPDVAPEAAPDAPGDAVGQDQEAGPSWPTCDSKPDNVLAKTLPEIWQDNPASATAVWVSGVFVTAVSKGGCADGSACQIFLQDTETFATLQQGAHHAIKLFVSGNAAQYFTGLAVGDRVDVLGHAWRYDLNPLQNELLLQVNMGLPGCAKVTGSGNPSPITGVSLSDLTATGYEDTFGPLLVRVDAVSGKPGDPTKTFALWHTGVFVEAGPDSIVSLSPFFLPAGAFSTLPTDGQTIVNFTTITGVFGMFVPGPDAGVGAKYLMLYPRTMADVVVP